MDEKQVKYFLVPIAAGLALWSSFNLLDWLVETGTIHNTDAEPIIYITVFTLMFGILVYFGATRILLKR